MSEPRNKRLISADTVYGLLQSTGDLMRERFTTKGRTLDSNEWRTCNVYDLEQGFWKSIKDRDFGSVLTYTVMLAGRDVNVADLIHNSLDAYNEQVVRLQTSHAEHTKKLKEGHRLAIEEAGRKMETMNDTIRLQGITNSQHEETIKALRAKLEEKGIDPDEAPNGGWVKNHYGPMHVGVATLESTPELCWSVEKVVDSLTECTVIQGDPAAVKDLVLALDRIGRQETASVSNIFIDTSLINGGKITEMVKNAASEGAATAYKDVEKLFTPDPTERQSKVNRLQIATGLILQLPPEHDGRATWLLNYASHNDADVQEAIRQNPRAFTSIGDAVDWVQNMRSEAPAKS